MVAPSSIGNVALLPHLNQVELSQGGTENDIVLTILRGSYERGGREYLVKEVRNVAVRVFEVNLVEGQDERETQSNKGADKCSEQGVVPGAQVMEGVALEGGLEGDLKRSVRGSLSLQCREGRLDHGELDTISTQLLLQGFIGSGPGEGGTPDEGGPGAVEVAVDPQLYLLHQPPHIRRRIVPLGRLPFLIRRPAHINHVDQDGSRAEVVEKTIP